MALLGGLVLGPAGWAQSVSYTYDALGRLTGAAYANSANASIANVAYVYDAAGNRTSVTPTPRWRPRR